MRIILAFFKCHSFKHQSVIVLLTKSKLSFSTLDSRGGGGGGDSGMVKKTRDDAVFVTGIGFDTTFENLRDIFGSVGNIKV